MTMQTSFNPATMKSTLIPFVVITSRDGKTPDPDCSVKVPVLADDSHHAITQVLVKHPELNSYRGVLLPIRTDATKRYARYLVYPTKAVGQKALDDSLSERIEIVAECPEFAINAAYALSEIFRAHKGGLQAIELSQNRFDETGFKPYGIGQFLRIERKTGKQKLSWAIYDSNYTVVECYKEFEDMRRRYQLLNKEIWKSNKDLYCPPLRYSPVIDAETGLYVIRDNFTGQIIEETLIGPDNEYRHLPAGVVRRLKALELDNKVSHCLKNSNKKLITVIPFDKVKDVA